MKICPDCRYPVKSWQEFCPHCGGEVERTFSPVQAGEDGRYACNHLW